MLLFIVLATLLCSSLVDARLAPVSSPEVLEQCQSQGYCDNAAVVINPRTFFPTVKASSDKVKLNLAVKSDQSLTFKVKAQNDKFTWEIERPRDNCVWQITSSDGIISFQDKDENRLAQCAGDVVKIAIRVEETDIFVDATEGKCGDSQRNKKLTACNALPDSNSIPGSHIWTLSISASTNSEIPFENAYVVYDLETTTTMTTANVDGTGNETTTTPGNHTTPHNSTADMGLSITTYALIVVSALLAVL